MSPEPSIDMFRPNRLRLKFNLENICSKFEKIKECGIEMSLDHPDPHKTTFYIPQGMDPREVSKHKQKFYAVSENFSLAPLSARLNDDEALDFNENLKRKCEKRDREFNECLALTPYAPNETLQPVENKTFRLRETETIRTISTEGVALNELEAYVQSIHPDGEIVFSAVENNVSIIKIRLKKTVSVSSDSQTEQLQITGGESLSENDFEREYRDIQRRSLTQLAIEGPVEKTKNEDENEDAISVRSGIMPFSQEEGQLSERLVDCTEESLNEEDEKDSVHSESVSLKEEIREDSAQPSNTSKTSVPMRKTPARACKSTTNSPATAKVCSMQFAATDEAQSNKNSGLSIRTNTDVQPKGTLRRSPRGVSQTVTPAPLTVARRRSERRTSGLIEPAESFESASQTSLPELFGIDDRVEEELGQRQDVEFDRQSGPIPHSENYFSAPEEVEKDLSDNTQQARKKKRKAKRLTQRKQKRIRQRHSSKVSQTAGSVTSGPIGKDEDGSGTVYHEVYTPEASFRGVQPEPGELTDQKGIDEALFQIPTVSSGRKRPASLLVGVSPVSKRSHQQNNTICPSNEELLSGFWQEDGQSLLNELVKTGPFQSMMGVAKDWLPVYSPIDKPLIDHWAEATVYWKENRSRDFTSGFQDFEGRQLISAAKARNNKMIHGFDCT